MPNTDQWLYIAAAAWMALLLAYSIYRLTAMRSLVNWVGLVVSSIMLTRFIVIIAYTYVVWAYCVPRYFINYFAILFSKIILYFLHEQRLAVFFNSRPELRRVGWIFRGAIFLVLAAYIGAAISQITVNCAYCYNTSTGGMTVTAPINTSVRYSVYSIEIGIGLSLLAGNFYALNGIMRANDAAGISSTSIYSVILGSDAVRFIAVVPVEIYKLCFSYDPSNNSGILPYGAGNGNNGFQLILDSYKVSLLLLLLQLPSTYARLKSKATTGTGGKTSGLRSQAHVSQSATDSQKASQIAVEMEQS
ncbi:hypothetical protein HK405_008102 [Cladochytrium tenue]|nr:hypothetical protein HK405_008102 [Cladochytrium tenue]